MSDAASELQAAVYARLSSDVGLSALLGGGKIHDQTPAHVAFPYVTFGRMAVTDWSTATERGSRHLFAVDTWSNRPGKKEILAIMALVRTLLDDAALILAAHHLVSLRLEGVDVRFDDDQAVHQGAMRFVALVED